MISKGDLNMKIAQKIKNTLRVKDLNENEIHNTSVVIPTRRAEYIDVNNLTLNRYLDLFK